MPKDVALRTLAGDPTSALHAAPKQYAEKSKVSFDDTTSGYLGAKIVAGDNVTITTLDPAGNETLEIAADPTSLPITISGGGSATILYVVGAAKHAVWYGEVTGDGTAVLIVPNDANDVSRMLTVQSAVHVGGGNNYYRRRAYDHETQSDELTSPPLTPGGAALNLIHVHEWGEHPEKILDLAVNADGSVDIVTIADGATYYVSLELMWF